MDALKLGRNEQGLNREPPATREQELFAFAYYGVDEICVYTS
jgi:hypothetical protein